MRCFGWAEADGWGLRSDDDDEVQVCGSELTLIIFMVDQQSERRTREGQIYCKPIPRFKGAASGLCLCVEVPVL